MCLGSPKVKVPDPVQLPPPPPPPTPQEIAPLPDPPPDPEPTADTVGEPSSSGSREQQDLQRITTQSQGTRRLRIDLNVPKSGSYGNTGLSVPLNN